MTDRAHLKDMLMYELEKPRSTGIVQNVARDAGAELVEVVAAMWDLVEDEKIVYTTESRLYIR